MTLWSLRAYSGREEVIRNAEKIHALTTDYSVDATLVAASIAEQASDVERIAGDFSERFTQLKPGSQSLGIAQLHRYELEEFQAQGLLPSDMRPDPYNPEMAIRGMAAKIQVQDEYLGTIMAANPHIKVTATDRWMLLALAQNCGTISTDKFFGEAKGRWGRMLSLENYQSILRYFVMHLEWLIANGWEIPDDVSINYWKMVVFNSQNSGANNAE